MTESHSLAWLLTGEIVTHFELYLDGLTLRTASGVVFNVFNRFRVEGFDGDDPCAMIGKKIDAIGAHDDCVTLTIGPVSLVIGMSDQHCSGPEAWLAKLADGTLIVENGS